MIIIPFSGEYRFGVYAHKVCRHDELEVYRFIVLKNRDNFVVSFTGLEQFSYPYTGQLPPISVRQKQELVYICRALNYFVEQRKVNRLADITTDMIIDYFDLYCSMPKRNSTEVMRSQQSLDNCVRAVSFFFGNLAQAYLTKIHINELLLQEERKVNRKSHRVIRRYIPRYVPKRPHSWEVKQLRDMPIKAARRLLELAWIYDPMVAFGIALQLYAGLRPGCVVNMRQNGSPLSPIDCIRFSYTGSAISGIEIDLTHEYVLRSDGVSVGKIKKERVVRVYKPFIPDLVMAYQRHMRILANTSFESQYMPMFVGAAGKAMTYDTYARRVKRLVYEHLKSELYSATDPMLTSFAHLLDSYPWNPHTLRHCFTVQLVLEGLDVAQLQYYRGDKSPESALTYIAGKGQLMQQVEKVHEKAIAGLRQYYTANKGEEHDS